LDCYWYWAKNIEYKQEQWPPITLTKIDQNLFIYLFVLSTYYSDNAQPRINNVRPMEHMKAKITTLIIRIEDR